MTDVLQPDFETLLAFVQGRLTDADASAVRAWLHTGATEEELVAYEALLRERSLAARLLAEAAARPIRARLRHLLHQLEERGGAFATLAPATRAAMMAPLSTQAAAADVVLELRPGDPVDVELAFREAGNYAVYVVDPVGRVVEWPGARGAAAVGARVPLGGIEFERGDRELEIVVLLDSTPPPPVPPGADEHWLTSMLSAPVPDRRVLRRTLRCTPFPPEPPPRS
jgi:hypothetical protein